MCVVEEEDKRLLVTTGLQAYNMHTDELEWSAQVR